MGKKIRHGLSGSAKNLAKEFLAKRYGNICYICGVELGDNPTIDHFDNDINDNYNHILNLRLCCHQCNFTKGKTESLICRKLETGNGKLTEREIELICQTYSYFNKIKNKK